VGDYPRQGFLAGAVVNFIALLGWSPKTAEEIFSMDELVARFSLEAVNRAPARFDMEKCRWVNQQHLAKLSDAAFASQAEPFVREAGWVPTENFIAVATAVRDKVRLLGEVPDAVAFLLTDAIELDAEVVAKVRANTVAAGLLEKLALAFDGLGEWSGDAAKAALNEVAAAAGAKPGQLMFPLRAALSGRAHGPDLGDILSLLGKDRSRTRIAGFLHALANG